MKSLKKSTRQLALRVVYSLVVMTMILQPVSSPGVLRALAQEAATEEAAAPTPAAQAEEEKAPAEEPAAEEEVKAEPAAPVTEEAPAPAETTVPATDSAPTEPMPTETAPTDTVPADVAPEAPTTEPTIDGETAVDPVLTPETATEGVITPEAAAITPADAPAVETWKENSNGSYTTNAPVALDVTYAYPENDKVEIKFTKLPEVAGTITIKEIKLSDKQRVEIGSLSNNVYDITSDMQDGSFAFELSLPMPAGKITAEQVEVKYAEKISDLPKAESTVKDEDVKEELNSQEDTLTVKGVDHLTIFFIAAVDPIANANVAEGLDSMGPINVTTGFPEWYQDKDGTKLAFCNDPADPNCAGPSAAEAFYWSAESTIAMPDGDAQLIMALEATDTTGQAGGGKAVFTRIRVRIDAPVAGDYTIIHPFGNKTYTVDPGDEGQDAIKDTINIDPTPELFGQALTVGDADGGGIGPFLRAASPAAPAGYLGNPAVEQTVTGSPSGNNFFEIRGPVGANFDGQGNNAVRNEHFVLLGKEYVDPSVLAVGVNSQVADTLTPTITGTFGGDNFISVDVSVAGQAIGAAVVDQGAKTWSIDVPGGTILTDGTYEVIATATDTVTSDTIIDATTNELTVDTTLPPPVTNETGLASRSPLINSQTRFPEWYQDTLGNKLALCADPDNQMCLADPIVGGNALSAQTGFGSEAFYWNGTSIIDFPNGGQALLVMALESAYGVGDPAPNEQMVFARIRVRIDAPTAGDYTVTHPFGSKTYTNVAVGTRTINDTIDIGTVTIGTFPGAFDAALNGNVGPFLEAVSPAPPAGYIGSPLVEQTVKGSPFGTNYFKIDGPAGADLGGSAGTPDVVQKNTFTLSGKIYEEPAVLTVSVTPLNSTSSTPTITGGVSDPTATVNISVGGQDITATVEASGSWSAAVPVALADGTYDVIAAATNATETDVLDLTVNELVINTAPDSTGLTAVSATDSVTKFPYWYQDSNNVRLTLCNNNDAQCITTPAIAENQTSSDSGFGDEAFYWNATSTIALPGGGQAKLVTGLEAAYANGTPAPNDQMVFTRVRINVDAPVAGSYTIVHPFGSKTYIVDPADVGVDAIKDTVDIGAVSVGTLSSAFQLALNGNIGPFLVENDPAVTAPVGYIGDPGVEQLVTGSPTGNNFFRIIGPASSNLDTADGDNVVEKNTFNLSGKIFEPIFATINVTPSNATLAVGATQQLTAATLDQSGSAVVPAQVVVWSSSDEAVATVDGDGTVTAVAPGSANILADSGAIHGQAAITVTADLVAPVAPVITTLAQTVDTNTIQITGTAEAGATIVINGGAALATDTATGGSFDIMVTLNQNVVNNLSVTATDASNNESTPATVAITHDNVNPILTEYIISETAISPVSSVGIKDESVINIGFSKPVNASISIKDQLGVVIRNVYTSSGTVLDPNTHNWNGRDAGGVVVTDGIYIVSVRGIDTLGHVVLDESRTITVDNTLPIITLDPYTLIPTNADIAVNAATNEGTLNFASHTFTTNGSFNFTATDAAGNVTTQTVTISNIDKTAPVITLNGNGLMDVIHGSAYSEPGATINDGSEIIIGGDTINANTPVGAYQITYDATDEAGNQAIRKTRIVNVVAQIITVTADAQTKIFGEADPAFTYTSSDPAISFTGALSRAAGDNAGIYPIVQGDLSAGANYAINFVSADFTITKIASETVLTCSAAEIYTGTPITPCSATVTGAGGLNENVTVVYTDNTNVGVASATATYAGDTNHNGSSDAKTFNINVDPTAGSNVIETTTNITDGTESGTIPSATTLNLTTPAGEVTVEIPAGLVITGPAGWDGTIELPDVAVTTVVPTPDSGTTATAVGSISIGFEDMTLTFNQGVRILLAGQAGKLIGYSHGAGTFTEITNICSADNQAAGDALAAGADCKIDVGGDLVVWTKHFSAFTTYFQTLIASSSNGDNDDDDDDDDNDNDKKSSKKKKSAAASIASSFGVGLPGGSILGDNALAQGNDETVVTDEKKAEEAGKVLGGETQTGNIEDGGGFWGSLWMWLLIILLGGGLIYFWRRRSARRMIR
ncbi:MAG: MBG domain-containing protein [Parcubacteria group bacterium]|jgi:hypothetical protein